LGGPTSKGKGGEGKGREEDGQGRGKGYEPSQYLEEVYTYVKFHDGSWHSAAALGVYC